MGEYDKKRDFRKTPEPGRKEERPSWAGKEPIFVVQEHVASTRHVDFRIEVDGVLKSWAVPKGPSTDPREKRLAVETEDHPLAYAGFEGTIPEGEYGGGTVIVWDRGSYRNLREGASPPESVSEQVKKGHVTIFLEGKKISGGYALVRTGGKDGKQWLFVKMKDDQADARRDPVSTEPESVKSKMTINEIKGVKNRKNQ
jgi:DNA ligase D-like protein (predicted 3'-phosphoesterase)